MASKFTWIALFSQTGSEISAISSELGFSPDLVLTNNRSRDWHPFINTCNVQIGTHDELMQYLRVGIADNVIITLHGYLRIIPEDITRKYEMYNGHPGLITEYPELKGKDPQEKVWNDMSKYTVIGSVVHKVIPEVDDGEVVSQFGSLNLSTTKESLYAALKQTSLIAWMLFLRKKFK
jgi:folate-dependent phosphoribosylglycinamide formyltransferase PurN